MRALAAVNRYFLKYRWLLLLGTLFVILSNIFKALSPGVIGDALDLLIRQLQTYQQLTDEAAKAELRSDVLSGTGRLTLYYLALALGNGLFLFLMRQTLIIMSRHIEYDQKNELFAHYQKLTPAFYKRHNTGDLMNRVAEDVGRVRMYVGPALMYFLNTITLFILVIWAMLKVNPRLTFFVLLPLPVLSVSIYFVNNLIEKRSERIQRQLSKLTSVAQEIFSGIRVIKAYAQEEENSRYFEEQTDIYKDRSLSLARVDAMFQPLMVLLIGLSTLLVVFVGGFEVIQGRLTAGNVAAFIIYVNMLTWPVASLGWVVSIVQRAAVSQRRINEFLQTQPDISSTIPDHGIISGNLEFSHVTFTYPDSGIRALEDISFHIKAGQRVAIIGRTGSGKTTIADLLLRLYEPDSGEIRLGGRLVQDYSLHDLRASIGYVPQDVFLFGDSIQNNIRFGLPDEQQARVEDYAKAAGIHDEIDSFRQGYDTLVGERGVTLSGGQKQRISIARALIKDAPLVVLDDCLSAVDAATEQQILDHLTGMLEKKTALIITHRLSAMEQYDQIILLNEHHIAATGTHAELLRTSAEYREMTEASRKGELI